MRALCDSGGPHSVACTHTYAVLPYSPAFVSFKSRDTRRKHTAIPGDEGVILDGALRLQHAEATLHVFQQLADTSREQGQVVLCPLQEQ